METRVFSPSTYTFGEQRPRPQEMKRKESDRNEGANGNGTSSVGQIPGNKKRAKRTSLPKC